MAGQYSASDIQTPAAPAKPGRGKFSSADVAAPALQPQITTKNGIPTVEGAGLPKPSVDMKYQSRLGGEASPLEAEGIEAGIKTPINSRPMPGASEGSGLREGLATWTEQGPGQVLQGLGHTAKGLVGGGTLKKGLHETISGAGSSLVPILPPIAAVAPVPTVVGAVVGGVGSKVGQKTAQALGGDEDTQNLAGDIGGLAGGWMGAKAPGVAGKITSKLFGPLSKDAAVFNLRKAINPSAADARDFLSEAGDQLDTIVSHGQKTGMVNKIAAAKTPGQAQAAVADIAESAAQADPYYQKFVKPYESEPVSTTGVNGYGGGSVAPNTATIGQLSARLRTINSSLRPKYVAGGGGSAQSQAAVTAEQAAQMQAEAAQIRNTLANEISRRTGVPADQIAAMRKNYGQLNDFADTVRYQSDATIAQENAAANKGMTLGDINPMNAKGKMMSKPLTNPVKRGLQSVFRYQANPAAPPEVNPLAPAAPRTPLWKGNSITDDRPMAIINRPDVPKTQAGRPLTVRAQRAASAQQAAQQAAQGASVTPPSGAQSESLVPNFIPGVTGNLPLAGGQGTLVRPPLQLPPGPPDLVPLPSGPTTPSGAITLPPSPLEGVTPSSTNLGPHPASAPVPPTGLGPRTLRLQQEINATPKPQTGVEIPLFKGDKATQQTINYKTKDSASARIPVLHPDGTKGTIPAAQISDATKQGYKLTEPLAPPSEYIPQRYLDQARYYLGDKATPEQLKQKAKEVWHEDAVKHFF